MAPIPVRVNLQSRLDMNLLDRLFNAYIPAELRTNEIILARAKSLVGLTFAAVLAGPSFIGVYLYLGHPNAAWAIAATLWLVPGIWFSLRHLKSLLVAQLANLISFNLLFTYLVWSTGGRISDTVAAWFTVVPVVSTFAGGPRFGLLALSSVLAICGGFEVAQVMGASFPVSPITDMRLQGVLSNFGLVPFVAILAIGSQIAKEQGDRQREVQMRTIESLIGEVGNQSAQVSQRVSEMVESLSAQSQQARAVRSATESNNQLAQTVEQTSATLASEADNAKSTAQTGADVVGRTISNTMDLAEAIGQADSLVRGLQSRSQEISSIADKIKGLAFQTNILALNATIEAAHAGTHGKGFAVVADNVRKLASEAGDAAAAISTELSGVLDNIGQTAQLLGNGQSLAESGRQNAAKANEALQSILDSVAALHDEAGKLKAVSRQQLTQNAELSQHASQMEQGIQLVAHGSSSIKDAMDQLHDKLADAHA